MPEPSNRGIHFPEQTKQSAQSTMSDIKDKAQDVASSVADQAQQAWDSAREQVGNVASQIGDTAEDAIENVTSFIRRYPVACVLGGFFVGFFAATAVSGMPDMLRSSSRSYS
jgi:ElaB/YqjD/DUF883 family membrane-anchored ribosome-binding protein